MPWGSVWVWAVAARADVPEVAGGVREQVEQARLGLRAGDRRWAMGALDAAWEVAHTAAGGATGSVRFRFDQAQWAMGRARRAIWNGHPEDAARELAAADRALVDLDGAFSDARPPADAVGADVVNALGEVLGEVAEVRGDHVVLALGPFDLFGFLDLPGRTVTVPRASLVFGATGDWQRDVAVFTTAVSRGELERLSYELGELDGGAVIAAR